MCCHSEESQSLTPSKSSSLSLEFSCLRQHLYRRERRSAHDCYEDRIHPIITQVKHKYTAVPTWIRKLGSTVVNRYELPYSSQTRKHRFSKVRFLRNIVFFLNPQKLSLCSSFFECMLPATLTSILEARKNDPINLETLQKCGGHYFFYLYLPHTCSLRSFTDFQASDETTDIPSMPWCVHLLYSLRNFSVNLVDAFGSFSQEK